MATKISAKNAYGQHKERRFYNMNSIKAIGYWYLLYGVEIVFYGVSIIIHYSHFVIECAYLTI